MVSFCAVCGCCTRTDIVKPVFHYAEFCARSGIFLCFVISRVELIRKDKENFRSARKIPTSGKPA
jgi:hypothetical protein